MQTKLTLRLDEGLIEQAKAYSKRTGKSVSRLVVGYFALLGKEKVPIQATAPITQSLIGILGNTNVDEEDYRQYLSEKYR